MGTRERTAGGFSLIELLVVLSLIGALTGLILRGFPELRDRSLRARAEGEMAVISHALERYRLRYGDYPWCASAGEGAAILHRALRGGRMPDGGVVPTARAHLLSFEDPLLRATGEEEPAVGRLLDPWGDPYQYVYEPLVDESGRERNHRLYALWSRRGGSHGGREGEPDGIGFDEQVP